MSEKNLMQMINDAANQGQPEDQVEQPNKDTQEKPVEESKDLTEENAASENKKSLGIREGHHYERSNNQIPDFLKTAEKIPDYMQAELAQHRRNMSSHSKLTEDDLVYAEGESVDTFKTSNGPLTMLKMRIEVNNAPIYIPINHAGVNYRHLDDLVGQRLKVAIDRFVQTNEGEVGAEYILLGSIQQAEFIIGGTIYSQYLKDKDAVRDVVREGVITQVIYLPEREIEQDGERVTLPNRSAVFVDYHGMTIRIKEDQFHYRSLITPLTQRAFIGEKIKFRFTMISKGDYRDTETAKKDVENGIPVPKGIRYFFVATRLPFVQNPNNKIRARLNHKTVFKAYIVRCDPIKGILVEVAPSWWIKGYLPANAPVQPSQLDATYHTPVVVRLNFVDFTTKSGQCQIIRFPKGVVRRGISEWI